MKVFFVCLCLMVHGILSAQQLTINSSAINQDIVSKLLGTGVTVSNVNIPGDADSRGIFSGGNGINMGINEGVVLATGPVSAIPDPSTVFFSGSNSQTVPVDPVVAALFPDYDMYDFKMLEFNFTASFDRLNFSFVFASEEYPEYICTAFNDVFGFILSEVASDGSLQNSRNIAMLPGTNTVISINTVNNGEHASCEGNTGYFVNNYSEENINFVFGGATVKIPIDVPIQNGTTYNIKLFVADVSDNAYNSAVFFEANSFSSPPPCAECVPSFSPVPGQKYLLSAWVKEQYLDKYPDTYDHSGISISFNNGTVTLPLMKADGPIVDGWQRIEQSFTVPAGASNIRISMVNDHAPGDVFFDDIRIHPFRSNMKSFVYDPSTQRLIAELDENNYSTRYEYDDEGILIRVKKETERGVLTIKETRNNQSKINIPQQ